MITPDANIILYAYNEDAPQHQKAKEWLVNFYHQRCLD